MTELSGEAAQIAAVKKSLQFTYEMKMSYDETVQKEYFTIRALPKSDERQTVSEIDVQIKPETVLSWGADSFGSRYVYGFVGIPHKEFICRIKGTVRIGQVLFEEPEDPHRTPLFRHPHGMNVPGPKLKEYFRSIQGELEENSYVNAVYLMHLLHRDFTYCKGSTDVKTTAEQAWIKGKGVCQDYAHILVALCHMAGIPARYVTGIIVGEGASHAWTEVLYRGRWIGLDPTNDLLVAGEHIKFAHGRDAADCMINRGLLRGGGCQTQQIRVSVVEE